MQLPAQNRGMESISQSLESPVAKPSTHHNSNLQQIPIPDPDPIDFEECLRDSPKFRQILKNNLNHAELLQKCISKTIVELNNYILTGQEHLKSHREFVSSMKTLNTVLGKDNQRASNRIKTLLETFEEIARLQEIVIDQSQRTVGASLCKFIEDDLLKIRETRKSFDKIGHEFDQALVRHSQPIKKQQEDSENLLIATSTAFTHTSLDLSIQLTSLRAKEGHEILRSLLSFTRAYGTFFHQGTDLFEDLKPHIGDTDEFLDITQDEYETLTRNLPAKHLMVSNNELRPVTFDNKAQLIHLEGYLFKRASNGFKVWNRRWFILKDHRLSYQKRGDTQPTVMEDDLRLLTVRIVDKLDSDRRFCFEVLSPHKSHILQADSEAACKTWMSAIQAGINAAYHDTELKSIPSASRFHELTNQPSSSWGSGFSFKALHQQATNKLSYITSDRDKDSHSKSRNATKSFEIHKYSTEPGDGLEEEHVTVKTDDLGRTYAPLGNEDDSEEMSSGDGRSSQNGQNNSPVEYPAGVEPNESSNTPTPPEKPQRAYMIILAMAGNDECADCGDPQPRWASINLGITLCIECAGIHRSLGVHLSKVRSLTLDTEVWSPEIVQLMLSLGNTSVNSAYLACYRGQVAKIEANSCREDRENWIKHKYLSKSFMRPSDVALDDTLNESADSQESAGNGFSLSKEDNTQVDPDDVSVNTVKNQV